MKEAGSANRRIVRHTCRSDVAIKRYWQERVDNSRFQRHDVPITPTHSRARLQRCLARSGWNPTDWEHIVFSEKSHFQLCPDNHRRRVWRRLVQRADPAFTTARHTSLQSEVMVWSAISFDSRAPLGVISHTYSTSVSRRHSENRFATVPLAVLWSYFQQNNARPHTVRVTMNCLKACQTLP
ncbi:transposable element Tc1 transposase [Trichonephila clavipes]|nr:transposable element Tc1 transposase [Trichonephila clavipes]